MPKGHDESPDSESQQSEYTCLACGKSAYPTGGDIDTFDPDAAHIQFLDNPDDKVTICFECLQTDDWEKRARSRRSASDTASAGPATATNEGWFRSLWRQIRTRLDMESDRETERNHSSADGVSHSNDSRGSRSKKEKLEWKLEQEREWSDYLERELQAKEDRLREVEQELHQLRQERDDDSDGLDDPTISPHSQLLRTIFDVREALANATAQTAADSEFRDGLIRIDQQLADALEHQGIERIDTAGEADPRRHKVIETIPAADESPGTILEEYQAGYQRGGAVLRPAQVAVAAEASDDRGSDADDEPTGERTR